VHGIETRKQLIEALVALEFDVQVLQASIGNLLKQTMLAGKRGNFSKIVLAIIKDVAKLDLPKFLAALTQEGASGEDDVPPPAKPDSAPVPRNETELFAELKEKFPLVAEQMTQRGVTSLRQMWNASSEQMRGPWDTFLAEVKDLVVTGQPYRLEDARPKLGAAKLSMILTPGRPVKELWRDCAEATAAVARHQEPRMKFARLMMQYSPNLISAHLRSSPHAEGTSFTLTAPGEMRLAIEGNLLGLPRLERPAKAATYLKLFTGSQSPVDDKTLIPAAVEIMDMFKIPSVDVAKAFPKLELLYTDMVRHELPYLAQLMRLRQLYTLPDFVRASTRILRSDEEVGLRKKLQAPTSDLLRTEEGKTPPPFCWPASSGSAPPTSWRQKASPPKA